ncbi:hypothetical protein LJ739_01925 [Aestuariibacter halophilus]|uniref:Uncharacterized protein n=1 Tax=Fluctibacter halophilus TaxID=226011 RepID=A0ABS8G392_9ALTE|nr:hypothetical protein [Aestuariibacter halophilus]MCC2614998.1 hypothetical protein [Aestuariibacter halophilus]
MKNPKARALRRSISGWLTEQINNLSLQGDPVPWQTIKQQTRGYVLKGLQDINTGLDTLVTLTRETYSLNTQLPLVVFYIKGGNAFRRTVNGESGSSDWDTQILINPWLPPPVLDFLYGQIEDLLMDVFTLTAACIGEVTKQALPDKTTLNTVIAGLWGQQNDAIPCDGATPLNTLYDLELTKQQSIRMVFNHAMTGLWARESHGLKSDGPGMIFNEAIRPFSLHRLGYVWRAKAKTGTAAIAIDSPILMELIDVTIPRKNTVEAIELWQSSILGIEDTSVVLPPAMPPLPPELPALPHDVQLPMPGLLYHAREQLIMLSEVADGSSRHVDKMKRRIERFIVIWNLDQEPRAKAALTTLLQETMGQVVDDSFQFNNAGWCEALLTGSAKQPVDEVAQVIRAHSCAALGPSQCGLRWVAILLDVVHQRSDALKTPPSREQEQQTSAVIGTIINQLNGLSDRVKASPFNQHVSIEEAGFSDDPALQWSLDESSLFTAKAMPISGIDCMIVVRTNSKRTNQACVEDFSQHLQHQCGVDQARIHVRHHADSHSSGLFYASTLVVFNTRGSVQLVVTFSSADEGAWPRRYPYNGKLISVAALPSMASQRRVCAAMTEDYVIRTALARQVSLIECIVTTNG